MRTIALLLFTLLLFSCSRKLPAGILPPPLMQAVLWDVMRADEFVEKYAGKDSTYNKKEGGIALYEQIFRIHNVTKAQFEASLSFYTKDPELFKEVIDSMEAKREFIMQERYNKPASDSIKKKIKFPAVKK